jgi:Uma2 family endonuclease
LSESTSTQRRATYEEIVALPEHVTGEIIDGVLYTHGRPHPRNLRVEGGIIGALNPFDAEPDATGQPGGWWLLREVEWHSGEDVIVPEFTGWRRERMPRFPDGAWVDLSPDWACQIVSTSTTRLERAIKMPYMAKQGIPHLWFVDPIIRVVEVYRLEAGRWVLLATHEGDSRVRMEPFEVAEIDLSRWWVPGE